MEPTYDKVHYKFKLNGHHYAQEDIIDAAYNLIKEGEFYDQVLGEFLLNWMDSHDYVEVKTSGSTGTPKKIRISKQAMVKSAIMTGNFFKLEPGDRALHCLPTNFIAGKMMLIRAIVLGLELDIIEPSSHPLINYDKTYHFCAMVPLQLSKVYNNINNIKTLIVGGAPVTEKLKREIKDIPTKVFETYGMTETITHIALKPLNQTNNKSSKLFVTLPDVTVSLDDRDCLVVNAPHVSEEPIVTNDMVRLQSEKEFEWLGRIDNVINSAGVKLFPEQIENKLQPYIDRRYIIASLPDSELGEKVVLLVEGEKMKLDKSIFDTLEKHEVPKDVLFVPKFSETFTGKVQRAETVDLLK